MLKKRISAGKKNLSTILMELNEFVHLCKIQLKVPLEREKVLK